jgi:cobalt-zinc-cadmium efflux system membrane fusion protein
LKSLPTAALLCLCAACSHRPEGDAAAETWQTHGDTVEYRARELPATIRVASVGAAARRTLPLSGRVTWTDELTARIYTPFNGRVEAILVQPGEHVHKGQPLLTLSSGDYGQAQADERKAAADALAAERNQRRSAELLAAGVIARKDAEQSDTDWHRAQAELARAQARLRAMGDERAAVDGTLVLRSPLAGVVVERNVNAGTEVRADAALPLFVVSDPGRLTVVFDVPEALASDLQAGQDVNFRIAAQPGRNGTARLTQVAVGVDPQLRTVRVRGRVTQAPAGLRGDAYIQADVPMRADATMALPASALFLLGEQQYVFVADGRRFRRQPVTVTALGGETVAVSGGLDAGQSVVTDGALYLEQLLEAGT